MSHFYSFPNSVLCSPLSRLPEVLLLSQPYSHLSFLGPFLASLTMLSLLWTFLPVALETDQSPASLTSLSGWPISFLSSDVFVSK